MSGEIDLRRVHFQQFRDLADWHFAEHGQIENLILLRRDVLLYAHNRGLQQVLLPFLFPDGVECVTGRVAHAVKGVGAAGLVRELRRRAELGIGAFAEMINNAPPGDEAQPVLEGTLGPIVAAVAHLLRHGDHGFLHHVARLGFGQPGLDSDRVDQFPIRVEKVLPTAVVAPVAEALDQARPRGGRISGARFPEWG